MVPDLARISELVALLGDPQHAARVVHVTGTNGKGSVVRMVSALLEACGLRTGTYVSPHLHDVRERIMVGLRPVSTETFAEVHGEVEPLAQLLDARAREQHGAAAHPVTFFEVTTAMALAHFAAEAVDVAVVEVGLGGRWDATNVVHADVAVLTDVDLDHTELLGATAADIAREKVGIVKQGSAVVSAVQPPEVAAGLGKFVGEVGEHGSRGLRVWSIEYGVSGNCLRGGSKGARVWGIEYRVTLNGFFQPSQDSLGSDTSPCPLTAFVVPASCG
jgi:dihydrofolate synthase/folylpolyglutamate synthase